MLKKIRALTAQHAIPAALIIFILIKVLLFALGKLYKLAPHTLIAEYVSEIILIIIPMAIVAFFGFSPAFKKGNFLRGLLCCLPYLLVQVVMLVSFFAKNLGSPEVSWNPGFLIIYSVFTVLGVGIREECIYRATLQNIVAKKHANSVKGIWISLIVASIFFGVCHITNLLYGVHLYAVLTQIVDGFFLGLLFGAVYLRSGSLWACVLIHSLTDLVGLAESTFLYNISDIADMNNLAPSFSFPWKALLIDLVYLGLTAFLLRPSKCKQIRESFCFAEKEPNSTPRR